MFLAPTRSRAMIYHSITYLILNSDVPNPDPGSFFKLEPGRIRISDKNGNIQPDPDPDSDF